MMNNNSTTTTSSSSDLPLSPPSPEKNHETYRSFPFDHQPTPPPAIPPKKPRKKRTKLIRIDNSTGLGVAAAAATSSFVTNKPKSSCSSSSYGKKPDPGAPKITRPCSECGRRFWSLKALFGHMRCHPERQWRGINPPPNFRLSDSYFQNTPDDHTRMTEEDQQVASCLLLLANGPPSANSDQTPTSVTTATTTNTMTNVVYQRFSESDHVRLGCGDITDHQMDGAAGPSGVNCRFECSSCKKVFGSHQALGGHRASHKNVKGCFAITRIDGEEEYSIGDHERNVDQGEVIKDCGDQPDKMLMVLGHKCSICLRVFSSGQALGGHKRCHWERGDEPSSLTQGGPNQFGAKEASALDLNLPAPFDDGYSSSSFTSGLSLDLRLGL